MLKPIAVPGRLFSILIAALLTTGNVPAARASEPAVALPTAYACGPADAPIPPGTDLPDSIIPALYEIVSGAAGSSRDWNRLRALHVPGARITPTRHLPDGALAARPGDLEDFIRLNQSLFANRGFFEREIARKVERYGHLAHVLSTYESREMPDGAPYARGVNSFQLLNDGRRWCVLSATWDGETAGHPIPPRYLHSENE